MHIYYTYVLYSVFIREKESKIISKMIHLEKLKTFKQNSISSFEETRRFQENQNFVRIKDGKKMGERGTLVKGSALPFEKSSSRA